jgi:hypothetical protein
MDGWTIEWICLPCGAVGDLTKYHHGDQVKDDDIDERVTRMGI